MIDKAKRLFPVLGMYTVLLGCMVGVLVPVVQGKAPDTTIVAILGTIAGVLFRGAAGRGTDEESDDHTP